MADNFEELVFNFFLRMRKARIEQFACSLTQMSCIACVELHLRADTRRQSKPTRSYRLPWWIRLEFFSSSLL